MDRTTQKQHDEQFLRRLLARRPHEREHYEAILQQPPAPAMAGLEAAARAAAPQRDLTLETLVNDERPVLFVRDGHFDTDNVTILGNEAKDLVKQLNSANGKFLSTLPLIGRIDVTNFPNTDFLGTGWFVDTDVVVTNRHVASLIAKWDGRKFVFSRGVAGRTIQPSFCNAHEYDDLAPDTASVFEIKEVLYIEPESGPNDIAFVRVARRPDGAALPYIPIAPADIADNVPVCVIGYPARAPRHVIPDQARMEDLFRGRYDVKRAAPGFSMGTERGTSLHDCSTLGGNSGSVLLDLSGRAVGLHFAGLYHQANYAVPASVLTEYVRRKRWNRPLEIETRPPKPQSHAPATVVAPSVAAPAGGEVTVTIPLVISVKLGAPVVGAAAGQSEAEARPLDIFRVEEAVLAFWDARPGGVLAARVGYFDEGDTIGDRPCIAVSVAPDRWPEFESSGPRVFQGVPIRYLPADVDEQIMALPGLESVDSIAYDDDARTSDDFSFAPVDEAMEVVVHVGPEYSWEVLQGFLKEAKEHLVLGMYEFHAPHIKDAIEQRLKQGLSLKLVADNATFAKVRDADEEFDRVEVFGEWAEQYAFTRIIAPEGTSGLISDSYHIKVAVRQDNTFWLSSGNWKAGSSQPVITQKQRDEAAETDLPGNREWHVVIKNKTLAGRFRSHILQDFARATELGGGPLPKRLLTETFVDVPLEEAIVLERRPPSRILKPEEISRPVKVRPLLTPDRQGEVYAEAVLELIRSAKESLLFQIPYIAMPANPRQDRGYIDELIRALTAKLKSLDDARVILRSGTSGGKKFSHPAHAAWYFKSKGVDVAKRLHAIENHHTKGMIVDGRRVLLGSHNWSKPGVTLNRDASLLFDDEQIAGYFAQAFEIDWERSNSVTPRRFVESEAVVRESVGAPPPGYQRVRLSEWLKDD